jgi:hypothetical protein
MDMIIESLLTCNIIGAGNLTPSDQQAQLAFQCLAGLIDTSNADPLRMLTAQRVTFTLTPPKQAYTIGPDPSLDIEAPRPRRILRANVAQANAGVNAPQSPMRVMAWHEYDRASQRNTLTPLPTAIWYDRGYAAIPNPTNPNPPPENFPVPGFGTITILGVPTAANVIEFWAAQLISEATSYFDELIFPPGYYEYLLYGTCVRIYPRFARPVDPTIAALYQDAKLTIGSTNANYYETPTEPMNNAQKTAPQSPAAAATPNARQGQPQ